MTMAIFLLAKFLVFAGALILARALTTVKSLNIQLPPGPLRNRWYAMTAMIVLFIVSYVGYVGAFWNSHRILLDLIVPGVFFFGACFVWLSAVLSLQTAVDVMRISFLETQAYTDPLTGAYNRRYLKHRLAEDISVALRYGHPLSVLLLDIDNFKEINDANGHQPGDQVLVEINRLIAKELRESDFIARLGGDEFLVIAPHTNLVHARDLAQRLRNRIQSHDFGLKANSRIDSLVQVTVSAGVASLGNGITNSDALIHAADQQLYAAKGGGRNRIVAADPCEIANRSVGRPSDVMAFCRNPESSSA